MKIRKKQSRKINKYIIVSAMGCRLCKCKSAQPEEDPPELDNHQNDSSAEEKDGSKVQENFDEIFSGCPRDENWQHSCL